MTTAPEIDLQPLADSDLSIPNPLDDIRWRGVFDTTGEYLGKIEELLVDEDLRKVRFLQIARRGMWGVARSRSLVPAEAVLQITDEVVRVKHDDYDGAAPGYDPQLVDVGYYASVIDYVGY